MESCDALYVYIFMHVPQVAFVINHEVCKSNGFGCCLVEKKKSCLGSKQHPEENKTAEILD